MMKALFAAIAGLQNHITYMDVVGNNIANVNTQGYKASRVTFQDMLTQTISGASAPTADRGGTNPQQVGLGMKIGGIDVMHTQGSLQATGRSTDFAIQGSGFFILRDGARTFYTRDGAFDVAVTGELVNPTNGFKVQGWRADTNGAVDTNAPLTSIIVPMGQSIAAQETTAVTLTGNLDSSASSVAPADSFSTTIDAYDSLGAPHPVTITYTKNVAPNEWTVTATSADPAITALAVDTGAGGATITFDANGRRTTPAPGVLMEIDVTMAAASGAGNFTMEVNQDSLTQFSGPGTVAPTFNNGYSAGSLVSFSVGPGGDITGIFSNGTTRPLGQVSMAQFTNPAGLQRAGSNNYEATSNSGVPSIGTPGTGGRGSIGAGVLEGSNTDLAREFTNVVIAQRGFQASSRIISTADQMLEGLVNLIR
ncbi:MAG: flagellar hook protein FlgE [Dehalococcoidia bacterium]|jgi:flagellar hook protein FlgE|nr:flagellar hook protein FlgE [Dehalococcoidia bacterium]